MRKPSKGKKETVDSLEKEERGGRTRERERSRKKERERETELEEKEDVESERVGDMCYLFPPCKQREKADIINRKLQIVNRRL